MTKYNTLDMLVALGAKNISTKRQLKNNTDVFEIPVNPKSNYNRPSIVVASYESGYVRRLDNGYTAYQLNPTRKCKNWYNEKWDSKERILIPDLIDRLNFIINYTIKNWRK
jgi:hypothetical protein